MIDKAHVVETLFGQRKRLWQRETRHEAMLLMKAVYANDAGARDKIVTAILEGPPQELLSGKVEHEAERESFEMLSFLESSGELTLPPLARDKLLSLRKLHPDGVQVRILVYQFGLSRGRSERMSVSMKSNQSNPLICLRKSLGFKTLGNYLAGNSARQLG